MSAQRCDIYLDSIEYDPTQEQSDGYVTIISSSEPGWSMTYLVQCVECHRRFNVKQIDGPALQWKWTPKGIKRKS